MISKFKIEILTGCLLLATLAIIFANKNILRSCELTTANTAEVGTADDREVGGASEASAEILGNLFRLDYRVMEASLGKNYSVLTILPVQEFQRDLSWVDRFEVTVRTSEPEGKNVKFYVKDCEPSVSEEGDETSHKYNESLLSVSNKLETVTVCRDEFIVPHWWQQRFGVKGDAAKPSFKNVSTFEFNVNTTGKGVIEVASIRCVGNWINIATLNQSLLWMWMGGALIGIIYRTRNLKRRLNDQAVNASQLLAHNNALKSESATYHELARRDPLTGLYNRYGLETELEELSSKYYFDYTMLLFDLDKFKEINDNFGHSYGDRVLFDVATIVRSMLGEKDIVARWGGDEFLVILHKRTVEQASVFAEEIRHSVSASDLTYSCSFGICRSEIETSFEATFSKADIALYDSKNGGRNMISSYQENDGRPASDHDTPVVPEITLLPNVLPAGEFTIYE